MRLPDHLEFVEAGDGRKVFHLNEGYYILIRDKNTGEEQRIIIPPLPYGTEPKEMIQLFEKCVKEQLSL